jgi:hypothetical protein
MSYYIKKHFKTLTPYPGPEGIHFSEKSLSIAHKFAASDGFLLYETGQSDQLGLQGAQCVYGYGYVVSEPIITPNPRIVDGREYPYVVKVVVEKRLTDRSKGIPARVLREQYGINMMPTRGGVVSVSEEIFREFKTLINAGV